MALSGVPPLKLTPPSARRIVLRPCAAFDTASGYKAAAKPYDHSLLHGFDAEDELSKLFSDSDGDDEAPVIPADPDAMVDLSDDTEDWRKDAVYLAFEQGWHGVFAPDEKLHVIIRSPEGLATQQRYISSLRVTTACFSSMASGGRVFTTCSSPAFTAIRPSPCTRRSRSGGRRRSHTPSTNTGGGCAVLIDIAASGGFFIEV
jgi:hypothetical protein